MLNATMNMASSSWLITENHTAADTLTAGESGSIHTNYGDGDTLVLTLPASAPVGTNYTFIVAAAQQVRILVSAAGEKFIANGTTNTDDGGADGYLVADDEGEMAFFVKVATGVWLAYVIGTWTWTQP